MTRKSRHWGQKYSASTIIFTLSAESSSSSSSCNTTSRDPSIYLSSPLSAFKGLKPSQNQEPWVIAPAPAAAPPSMAKARLARLVERYHHHHESKRIPARTLMRASPTDLSCLGASLHSFQLRRGFEQVERSVEHHVGTREACEHGIDHDIHGPLSMNLGIRRWIVWMMSERRDE